MIKKRIGFCCKISKLDPKKGIVPIPEYNFRSTTVSWLNRQSRDVAVEKLWELADHNIKAAKRAVEYVGNLEEHCRRFRLGSDLLPVYTEPNWSWFWRLPDVRAFVQKGLESVGVVARENSVLLSFHPGQFCCIVSDNDEIVNRSIEELEYHATMAKWMGYGVTKLDFKINVHLSGRRGPDGFDAAWQKMSPELRNCLTLENDEYQRGLDDLLPLGQKVGIVLDIHHHLIKEEEYISANDPRISQIIDSWQGVRPAIHYSQSREEHIGKHNAYMPTMQQMLTETKKAKLRAHSDFYPNVHLNEWALSHWEWADIITEAKGKNLASDQLAKQAKSMNLI